MSKRVPRPKQVQSPKGPQLPDQMSPKQAGPPPIRLQGGNGLVLYPKMKQLADGSWSILHPEEIKAFLKESRVSGLM